MKTARNPVAFTPLPVTIITSIIYVVLIVTLLVIHLVVPSAPTNATPVAGINLTEAWQDLQIISNGFHPYNSRRNDQVRDWILTRINSILKGNGVATRREQAPAIVFSDMTSNVTFSNSGQSAGSNVGREPGVSVYFEGTNIIIYIRGSDDEDGEWWARKQTHNEVRGGVLVNAHYDSVSTGFGTTDDGIGVVSIFQLVKHFTADGHQPKKGIVALLNNGEEDYLNGARAFSQHPMSQFAHTFLNLEGAGAGGRATLFRGTDTEVVRFYQRSKYPFASVLSLDAFRRGFVRSQTDYIIFRELGLRGLDLAFMEPRARYHTEQDDTRHTNIDSLWHMLSAALSTLQGLTSDTSSTFDGKSTEMGKIASGKGSDPVYFDLFGKFLAVFRLGTLFALSVTLLTVAPIILIILGVVLYKVDKFYVFSSTKHHHHSEGDDFVSLYGWRGVFRTPIIIILASAGVVGLAFLTAKVNPYIIYSSPYAVWSMMLSAWLYVSWFLSRAADFVRPSAFHRTYALLWMFICGWLILIAVTVLEQRSRIASGYFIVFFFGGIFLATAISFCELFGLPRKSDYANEVEGQDHLPNISSRPESSSTDRAPSGPSSEDRVNEPNLPPDDEDDVAETTSLLRNDREATFAHYTTTHPEAHGQEQNTLEDSKERKVYGDEQPWSWALPTWTWLIQFILLAPIVIVLVGQIGLLLTSGAYQTLADGNSALTLYVGIAVLSIFLFVPLAPFLHRYTYHIPTFLLLVFTGTIIYNLVAFPFSANNRLKLYFIQTVDLDTGVNEVSLTGVRDKYLIQAIRNIPSANGQSPKCSKSETRNGLVKCAWNGIPPQVVKDTHPAVPPNFGYSDWLFVNVTREPDRNEALFYLWGRDTRACKIQFDSPIADFRVDGAGDDKRFSRVSNDGSKEIRLWSRTWEKPWSVHVRWEVNEADPDRGNGMDGRVVCLWSDDNETGVIPALDEIRHFAPVWVAVSKLADGLVEGSKAFMV